MTPQQLNAWLAINIKGWHLGHTPHGTPVWKNSEGEIEISCSRWNPPENIAQAMECEDVMIADSYSIFHERYLDANGVKREIVDIERKNEQYHTEGLILSEVICQAIYKAKGGE